MRTLRSFAVLATAITSIGCGGGTALMHPAHTLPAGHMSFGAGASHNFILGNADAAIEEAIGSGSAPFVSEDTAKDFVRGSVAWSLMTPGLAPWVGGRVGVGHNLEAGLTYTGRAARIDGRHAFERDSTALSIGLGVTNRLVRLQENTSTGSIPYLDDSSVAGLGVDVPVIVGWRSSASVVQAYAGLRGGYETLFGTFGMRLNDQQIEGDARAARWFLGGLLGLVVGVKPVWVGLELDATYHRGSGRVEDATIPDSETGVPTADNRWLEDLNAKSGTIDAIGLTPTGVLIGQFN